MSQPRRTIGTLLYLLAGPLLWAAHLTVIYGSQSSLCAFDIGETAAGNNSLATTVILVATAVCIGLVVAMTLRPQSIFGWLALGEVSPDRPFLVWAMRLLSALSVLAILYVGLAAIILPACAQLR
jgi:hypothetical protein